MSTFVAMLRAVNVGGTGRLLMSELRTLCRTAGFTAVETYIASGNVVLYHPGSSQEVQRLLEAELEAFRGKKIPVVVRTVPEMDAILAANPFPEADPSQSLVIFLNDSPPHDWQRDVRGQIGERFASSEREIFVDYGGAMGASKLAIPAALAGTARNIRTVRKLHELADGRGRKLRSDDETVHN